MIENTQVFDSYIQRWKYASKLDSWPKMLVPAFLGQLLGVYVAGSISFYSFFIGFGMTFSNLLTIVFLNDWGDQKVDSIKRQMFPNDCSLKTIPDNVLSSRALLLVGLLAALAMLSLAWIGASLLSRPALPILTLMALSMLYSYTFYPLKLNYRGGGELVEMLGIGFLLPLFNAYLQCGVIWHHSYWLLLGSCSLALASALASGISDEDSDLSGGKQTFATRYGNGTVKQGVAFFLFVTPILWLATTLQITSLPKGIAIIPSFFIYFYGYKMQNMAQLSSSRAFREQRRYKSYLHKGIWFSKICLALGLYLAS